MKWISCICICMFRWWGGGMGGFFKKRKLMQAPTQGAVHVNSHSGYDVWTSAQSNEFIAAALSIEKELGITVSHETHRRRLLYSPAQVCIDIIYACVWPEDRGLHNCVAYSSNSCCISEWQSLLSSGGFLLFIASIPCHSHMSHALNPNTCIVLRLWSCFRAIQT